MIKRTKYRLLRHLPGSRGRRYSRKFNAFLALDEFERAIRHAAAKTCIDLGANIGHYTQKMAQLRAKSLHSNPIRGRVPSFGPILSNLPMSGSKMPPQAPERGTVLLWRHSQFNDNPRKYSTSSSIIADKFDVVGHGQAIEVRQINFIDYLYDSTKTSV